MASELYVGNLSCDTTGPQLGQLFAQHGAVESAEVVVDSETGESKGFGFVQMGSAQEGQKAMEALNGKDYDGRALNVKLVHPLRKPKAPHAVPSHGVGNGGGGSEQFAPGRSRS